MKAMVIFMKSLYLAAALLAAAVQAAFAGPEVESFFFSTNGSSMAHCVSYSFERKAMTLVWEAPGVTRRAAVSAAQYARLCALADELGLKNWDGFSGTDPNVLDGDGFGVHIVYAGGAKVDASGYMRFPQGYRMAKDALFSFFEGVLRGAPVTQKKY